MKKNDYRELAGNCFAFISTVTGKFRGLLAAMVLLMVCGGEAWGFGSDKFYVRKSSGSTGDGKVYVTTTESYVPTDNEYLDSDNCKLGETNYLYAKASSGSEFVGWTTSSSGTTPIDNSATNPFVVAVTSDGDKYRYAIFTLLQTYYFKAEANVSSSGGGTASVTPSTTTVQASKLSDTSATTNTFVYLAEPDADCAFSYWSETDGGPFVSDENPYTPSVTSTSTNEKSPTVKTLYANFVHPATPPSVTILPVDNGVTSDNLKQQGQTAKATITAQSGFTIHYRKGSTGEFSTVSSGTEIAINYGEIIEAYTSGDGLSDSKHVYGGYVVLQDLEDHNWTYYKGVDANVGDTPYKTKYASSNVNARIYSPDPRNVEIIYDGCGYLDSNGNGSFDDTTQGYGVRVSVDDNEYENTFIYYETLDKNSDGTYSYSVIPNPFSVRPKNGSQYYGCRKWIVKSLEGGTITDSNGKNIGVNGLIDGDTDIKFTPTSTYTENCISMKVVLCAFWEKAVVNVLTGTQSVSYTNMSSSANGGHRELQFIVLNKTTGSTAGGSGATPVTFTMVTPDGSIDYRNNGSSSNTISNFYQNAEPYKVEYCRVTPPTYGYDDNGYTTTFDIHLGRGIFNDDETRGYTYDHFRQMANETTIDSKVYKLRVESGIFKYVSLTAGFYGVDYVSSYSRWENYEERSSTEINGSLGVNTIWGCDYDRSKGDNSKLQVKYSFTLAHGVQLGTSHNDDNYVNIAFKSGKIFDELPTPIYDAVSGSTTNVGRGHWSVYLADASINKNWTGHRHVEVRGGSFLNFAGGWSSTPAGSPAISYRIMGGTWDGCIYGSGSESPTTGDNFFVFTGGEVKGWIAGGCNGLRSGEGYGKTQGTGYIYFGGNAKLLNGDAVINNAPIGNIYASGNGYLGQTGVGEMTNGTNVVIADNADVAGAVYGGGHSGYTLSTANVIVAGGKVGEGVYGGSRKNVTQGENSNVMILGGDISGGVFGACNESGSLTGTVNVTMLGGNVTDNVYGGGNNAAVSVSPVVTVSGGTVDKIFGGGKGSDAALTGNPSVTVKQTAASMSVNEVYGGGDEASVTGNTSVSISKGTTGSVFGGGKKAVVNGSTNVVITGATIINGNVYGGGNQGEVTGKTYVQVGEE